MLSLIAPLITVRPRALARAAAVAACLLAFPVRLSAQSLVFAEAEAESEVEEIPAPMPALEGLQDDIRRLKQEIEALRAEKAAASDATESRATARRASQRQGDEAGDTPAANAGPTLIDRLTAVEQGLGKLIDAGDAQWRDDAKKPSLVISGQVQADQIWFGQDQVSRAAVGDLQDGAQFRRLRIGARGTSFEVLEYSLGVDFALANQPSYLDNYIEWRELPWLQNVRVGHYFEPFSLERVTQNRNNTFMERSLVDTFAPARNMGIMTYGNTENELATWAIGTFRTNSDNTGNDSFDSGQALTMRGTWLPWWDEASDGRFYMHLGAAYSYRDAYNDQVRFRNTPEIRKQQPDSVLGPVKVPPSNYQNGVPSPFAPIFVDTGNISANNFHLFDPEFALIMGPLSLQSEYAFAMVDQIGGPSLFFNGYMAQVSYFLTGEHRPYDRKLGIHKRMEPFEDFFRVRTASRGIQTGLGAWEIAARFSNIVLNDANIKGNHLTDFTIGLNWYINPYTRWKFNYVHAFLQDDRVGNSLTDAYGMRFDFDF
ncbi:MAG: OprO/OprP family phosphate-selective porin [Planctomycetaceae bacterium]